MQRLSVCPDHPPVLVDLEDQAYLGPIKLNWFPIRIVFPPNPVAKSHSKVIFRSSSVDIPVNRTSV